MSTETPDKSPDRRWIVLADWKKRSPELSNFAADRLPYPLPGIIRSRSVSTGDEAVEPDEQLEWQDIQPATQSEIEIEIESESEIDPALELREYANGFVAGWQAALLVYRAAA